MNYWLMKSEPDVYSMDDLEKDGQTLWDGVRNYQARNFMRTMAIGDSVFFYHSNTKTPGIVGLMEVIENHVIDPSQFDPQSDYYDPKSSFENPRWQTVKVKFVRVFPQIISLDQLKQQFGPEELLVVKKGNRLSVMPIATNIAEKILILV
ncbi:MAG: EVE domain-containing protein [Snowella sp.]|jgi:predicted RNA-binding protein with PUA-like domain|nr:MAG: EVE domain-containing protein [Snowella sp.]